ncbi:hypothetical protein OAL39_01100 [bacterium]|jgi:hypothetical protein|nr:hypothetical protein [bacterium]
MKKLIFSTIAFGFLAISTMSLTSAVNEKQQSNSNSDQIENAACKHGQCYATAASTGNRCLHCVSNAGDTYCYQHK